MGEVEQKVTIGRIVHARLLLNGQVWPAIVVKVLSENVICAHVCTDHDCQTTELTRVAPQGANVGWFWPPR